MARTGLGEIPSCCSLTVLIGSAWVLLNYVLQTIFEALYMPTMNRKLSEFI